VAVASAGPYASLHLALQTDNHASTPPLSFLQTGCSSCIHQMSRVIDSRNGFGHYDSTINIAVVVVIIIIVVVCGPGAAVLSAGQRVAVSLWSLGTGHGQSGQLRPHVLQRRSLTQPTNDAQLHDQTDGQVGSTTFSWCSVEINLEQIRSRIWRKFCFCPVCLFVCRLLCGPTFHSLRYYFL